MAGAPPTDAALAEAVMFCSACGAPRPAAASYCTACGAAAGVRFCTVCGTPAAEGIRFCTVCGGMSPLPAPPGWPPVPHTTPPSGLPVPVRNAVSPPRPSIGVGRRALATLIDLVPGGLLYILIAALFGDIEAGEDAAALSVTNPALALWAASWFIYYVVMEARWGGTLGKLAAGIRVARRDGRPAGWREALLRTLLRPVDAFGFYLLAAVLVWSSPTRQHLGDRIAGTVVGPRMRE